MGFTYSPELYQRVNIASWVLSGLSILCSLFILGSAWFLHSRPHTRHTVDRISFRLLCWAMGVDIVYDVMYIGIYSGDPVRMPDKLCSGMVYIMISSMGAANWLCTCIAINLMLIIVFGINPHRLRLERYYVVGSFIMGVGPPLVPAALNHFGKDTTPWGNCYMRDIEVHSRIVKLVLDIYLWQALSCLAALLSTLSVLYVLFRTSRRTSKALFAGNPLNAQISSATLTTLNDRFITIALRISSYPIALVIINVILTAADLVYTEANTGVQNLGQWVLFCVFIMLYGGRGLILGLLGVFVDPCLRKGYRQARRGRTIPEPESELPASTVTLTYHPRDDYDHSYSFGSQAHDHVASLRYGSALAGRLDGPSMGVSESRGDTMSPKKGETEDKRLDEGVEAKDSGAGEDSPFRQTAIGPEGEVRLDQGAEPPGRTRRASTGRAEQPRGRRVTIAGAVNMTEEAEKLYHQVESQL